MKQWGIRIASWEKVGRSSSSLQQMCQMFRFSSFSDNVVPILDLFQKFTSIRKPIGAGLKRVATGSVSKGYQTRLLAQPKKLYLKT